MHSHAKPNFAQKSRRNANQRSSYDNRRTKWLHCFPFHLHDHAQLRPPTQHSHAPLNSASTAPRKHEFGIHFPIQLQQMFLLYANIPQIVPRCLFSSLFLSLVYQESSKIENSLISSRSQLTKLALVNRFHHFLDLRLDLF